MKKILQYINEHFDDFFKLSDSEITYLKELDNQYGELFWLKRNDYNYKDILNREEERDKFFEARKKGEKYYPQVKLGKCNYTDDHILDRLNELHGKFTNFRHCFLSKYYLANITSLIDDVTARLETLKEPKDKDQHKPSKNFYKLALKTIEENPYEKVDWDERNIEAEEAKKYMEDALKELGYDFDVKVYQNMIPRMNVLPEKILRVNGHSKFSKVDIDGLIAHEIKGHVGRRWNGYKLGLYLFVHGLFGRNITDEGLAVWNSLNLVDKPKQNILFNIALKYIISYHAVDKDFCELFDTVREILDNTGNKQLSDFTLYNTIIRNKRSCIDTKCKGGNPSDADYFVGYTYVSKMTDEERDLILKYNVGLNQLNEINDIKKFLKINNIQPIKNINVFVPEFK